MRRPLLFTGLLVLAAAAVALTLYATAPGVGVSPDSTRYLGTARKLLEGEGFLQLDWREGGFKPMTRYPPLYPALLTLGGPAGVAPRVTARWLAAFSFGASVLLMGLALHRATRGGAWAAALAALAVLASAPLLQIHTMAWSEPPALVLGLLALLLLSLHLEASSRSRLLAAAAAAGAALLTRYAALPVVAVALLALLLRRGPPFTRRAREAVVFAVVSLLPLCLWLVRNALVAGTTTERRLVVHWVPLSRLLDARRTMAHWLTDASSWEAVAAAVLLVGVALLAGRLARVRRSGPGSPLPWLLLGFAVLYAVFLLLSISFVDYNTPLDARLLSPVWLSLIGFVACALHEVASGRRWLALPVVALAVAFLLVQATRQRATVEALHRDGQGYASARWGDSELVARIRTTPPDVPVYVNDVWGVYFHTNRSVRGLPRPRDVNAHRPDPDYRRELRRMRETLLAGDGLVVRLRISGWRAELPPLSELLREVGLEAVETSRQGTIYQARPGDASESRPPTAPRS